MHAEERRRPELAGMDRCRTRPGQGGQVPSCILGCIEKRLLNVQMPSIYPEHIPNSLIYHRTYDYRVRRLQ